MTRHWALMVALLTAFLLGTACGGSGEGSASGGEESKQQVRDILQKLIVASQNDDLAAARPHLDVATYLYTMDSPEVKRLTTMSEEDRAGHEQSAFNQLQCVKTQSMLNTPQAIGNALANAQITVNSQTKSADVLFRGPDSQGSGTVAFRARLSLAPSTGWKLGSIDPEF